MRRGRFAIGLLALLLWASSCTTRSDTDLVVFGAASLTDVLTEAERQFEADHPDVDVVLNLGGSNALREQIRLGADADLFIPADQSIVTEAIAVGDLRASETPIATNSLAVAVPAGNPAGVSGLDDFAQADLLLGICAEAVPCGQLARAAFDSAGVIPSIDTDEPDVRSLLAKIAAGELDAGIVYASDIATDPAVDQVDFPHEHQQVNTYVIAPTANAPNLPLAQDFVDFLQVDEGRSIIERFGFQAATR